MVFPPGGCANFYHEAFSVLVKYMHCLILNNLNDKMKDCILLIGLPCYTSQVQTEGATEGLKCFRVT